MDNISVVSTAIRTALIADSTLADKITFDNDGTDVVKVVLNSAPSYLEYPYVLMEYISGGKDNMTNNNGLDILMTVSVVSTILPSCLDIAGDIERVLADNEVAFSTGWASYAPVRNVGNILDSWNIQNTTIHRSGGIYRFRAVQGVN